MHSVAIILNLFLVEEIETEEDLVDTPEAPAPPTSDSNSGVHMVVDGNSSGELQKEALSSRTTKE